MKNACGKTLKERSKKSEEKDRQKRQTKKVTRKLSCGSLTCANAGKEFMRAYEMRESHGRQSLREISVGTSRKAKGRGNISVGNFRWITSALKRFELSGIDTRVRGNPEERRC